MVAYITKRVVKAAVIAFAKSQGWSDEDAKQIGKIAGLKASAGMMFATGDIPGAIAAAAEEGLDK